MGAARIPTRYLRATPKLLKNITIFNRTKFTSIAWIMHGPSISCHQFARFVHPARVMCDILHNHREGALLL